MKVVLYDFPLSICCQMARLALVEKGVAFERHHVDISEKKEQFEAWYLALNPKGVVPTLVVDGEVVTDTIRIVQRVNDAFAGPELMPADEAQNIRAWLRDLMAPRYGVLLYSRMLGDDGSVGIIEGRGEMLARLREAHPHAAELLDQRIEGNRRLRETLADPEATRAVVDSVHDLVKRVEVGLGDRTFLVGDAYSLADCFCTAALARFAMQGFSSWWDDLPAVAAYYERMRTRPSFGAAGVVDDPSASI